MGRTRSAASASPAELPAPHRFRYPLATAGSLTAAVALVVVPDHLSYPGPDAPVSTTVMWTSLQLVGPVGLLVMALYMIGRTRVEWNAWRARQLDVAEFADERVAPHAESAMELTALFERKLTESRIYRTAAVPDAGRVYDFIQIVENAADAVPQGWWKAATRLIQLVRPPSAFRVSATLLDGQKPGRHRIVIELLRLPRFVAAPLVIEDSDWNRLLARAANSVAALIFPVTKVCLNDQWIAWRNCAMPTELFDAYQRAHQFQAARRYDEALSEFYRALEYDPANVYVRLEIAQLLERLDLYLEALAIYDDVVIICSRADKRLATWWNSTDFVVEKRRRGSGRGGALLLARYRHALVLGLGDRIAAQWWPPSAECGHDHHWDPRRGQRTYLRATLTHRFERYKHTSVPMSSWRPRSHADLDRAAILSPEMPAGLSGAAAAHQRDRRAALLRNYLCTISQYEFERLVDDTARRPSIYFRRNHELRDLLSPYSIRLGLLWTTLRRAMAHSALSGESVRSSTVGHDIELSAGLRAAITRVTWPPDVPALYEAAGTVLHRKRAGWHEHYSAACVLAVTLLSSDRQSGRAPQAHWTPAERETWARLAIRQLHKAAAVSHTHYLAERRPWLMYEDRDLDTLRGTEAFRNFETLTFAPARPASLRPQAVKVLELVIHQAGLVAVLADLMVRVWQTRRHTVTAEVDPHVTREWHQREEEAWRQVTLLAVGHRDWHIRFTVTSKLTEWLDELGDELPKPGRYSEDALYDRYARLVRANGADTVPATAGARKIADLNRIADDYIAHCEDRMRGLATELHRLDEDRDPADDCPNASSAVALMTLSTTGLLRSPKPNGADQTRYCVERAELWESLRAWFDDESAEEPGEVRREAFRRTLRPSALRKAAALTTRGHRRRSPLRD